MEFSQNTATATRFERFINPALGDLLHGLKMDVEFVRAEGSYLYDAQGRAYLDFIAGFGAVPLGHRPPRVLQALQDFIAGAAPSMVQPAALVTAGTLAERLLQLVPGDFSTVWFANSGTEAVEAAIKAARAATGRSVIVSAEKGFHGKTLGALSATQRPHFQQAFGAPVAGFASVPFGDGAALTAFFQQHPQQVAAVLLEPIQGEGGINEAPPGYLQHARELCDAHGALLIIDEVQTGLGRTGDLFAISQAGISPDILVLAKALGGGVVPIGACVMNARAWSDTFGLRHSSTFAGNTLACQVAHAVLDALCADDGALLRHVRERGEQLEQIHRRLCQRYPQLLSGYSGRGLMQGLRLAVNRHSFPAAFGTALGMLGEQGNLIMVLASYLLHVCGLRMAPTLNSGQVLRVEPPLTIRAEECERYGQALEQCFATLASGDTSAIMAHLIDGGRKPLPAQRRALRGFTAPVEGGHGLDSRFAFILHPIDYASYGELDESLRAFDLKQLGQLSALVSQHLEPDVLASTVISAESGAQAYGEFVVITATARNLLEMPSNDAMALVCDAVRLAKKRGARIVGLGAFTSVITQGGLKAVDEDVAITTGNSYTVISAVEAVALACRQLGEDFHQLSVAVVGAGGAIGGAVAALLLSEVSRLTLVGNPANPAKTKMRARRLLQRALPRVVASAAQPLALAIAAHPQCPAADAEALAWGEFAETLLDEDGAVVPLRSSVALEAVLPECKVVVTATSSPQELIHPQILAPGAIVCDMSRPSNTSRKVLEARPDVLVIDGGVVEVPGRPYLGFNFGFPRGIAYACMAETMMLALEGDFSHTSLGSDLSRETLDYMRSLADKHGFKLAGLRSFDRVLSGLDWNSLRQARQQRLAEQDSHTAEALPALPRSSGEVLVALPELAGSVAVDDQVNAVEQLLDRHLAAGRGDHTAVIHGERAISYAALAQQVAAAVQLLEQQQLVAGDGVAVLSHDCPQSLALVLAAMRIGAHVCYLNPFFNGAELEPLLQHTRPRLLLINEELDQHSDGRLHALLPCLGLHSAMARHAGARLTPAQPLAASTAAICLFSSGSTGQPKAVLHSHRDILNTNLNYVPAVLQLTAEDISFSASRMFFAYGFNSVHFALFAGATAVLAPPRPRPEALFDLLERHRPSVFFAVPTVLLLLLQKQDRERDLSSLRRVVSAGEPLPVDLFDAWQARFGQAVIDGIGCTESLSTYISNRAEALRLGATGQVMPGFALRLLNAAGDDVALGEIGTLWLRGNTLCPAYWRDAEASAQVYRGEWFCTNDMFHRDAQGWFYYMGRANDMLKVGGCWVSPVAIEQAIRQHAAVSECAVIAREAMGNLVRPVAYVVLRPGFSASAELANAIRQHARSHLPPQQYPHFVEFIDALPTTANGKVQRYRLRNLDRQRVAVELQESAG